MSVRFDNNADFLSLSTANIVAADATAFSVTLWANIRVDTNAYATAWYSNITNSTNNCEVFVATDTDGTTGAVFESTSTLTGASHSVGTWYFMAYVRTNTARSYYYGTEAGGTLTEVTNADSRTVNTDMDVLRIGNDIYSEPWNGDIYNVKLWGAALSDAEIDAEWRSLAPVRTSNLRGDWRLAAAASATTDSSGNSLTLTANGTLTDGTNNPTHPAAGGATLVHRGLMLGIGI